TPSSTASRRRALTVSAPASCPATTGSPRRRAQRPLPSVMIATLRAAARSGTRATYLNLEDLFFLVLEDLVELADADVGDFLELPPRAVFFAIPRLARLLQLPQVVHHVAADVAHRDPAVLGDVADDLDQLLAPLLGQLGDTETDEVAVVVG